MIWLLFAVPLLVPLLWFVSFYLRQNISVDITQSGATSDLDVPILSYRDLTKLIAWYPATKSYEVFWEQDRIDENGTQRILYAKLIYDREKRELKSISKFESRAQPGYEVTWENVTEHALSKVADAQDNLVLYRKKHPNYHQEQHQRDWTSEQLYAHGAQ